MIQAVGQFGCNRPRCLVSYLGMIGLTVLVPSNWGTWLACWVGFVTRASSAPSAFRCGCFGCQALSLTRHSGHGIFVAFGAPVFRAVISAGCIWAFWCQSWGPMNTATSLGAFVAHRVPALWLLVLVPRFSGILIRWPQSLHSPACGVHGPGTRRYRY